MQKASIINRWVAMFIEGAILTVMLMIPNMISTIGLRFENIILVLLGLILHLGILIAYLVINIQFWKKGQSIGKRLLGLRVVNVENYQPLGLGEMALREIIGKWISSVLIIGYIIALFDSENRTLHDRIVGSIVVEDVLHNEKTL